MIRGSTGNVRRAAMDQPSLHETPDSGEDRPEKANQGTICRVTGKRDASATDGPRPPMSFSATGRRHALRKRYA